MSPIVIYFLFLTVLIAYLLMRTHGDSPIKVVIIAVLFYVSSAVWFSFDSYRGWPTDSKPKRDVILLSVVIFEKTRTEPGSIFAVGIPCVTDDATDCTRYSEDDGLLARLSPYKAFGYVPKARNTPRVYEIEYTEENRKKFAQARENIAKGGRSIMRGEATDGEGRGGEDGTEGQQQFQAGIAGNVGPDSQDGSRIEDSMQIVNEGPEDLLTKD